MRNKREKLEEKIKELNEIRAMYHRRFKDIEEKWKDGEISEDTYNKHKEKYEKQKEKIKNKIHILEEKLASL